MNTIPASASAAPIHGLGSGTAVNVTFTWPGKTVNVAPLNPGELNRVKSPESRLVDPPKVKRVYGVLAVTPVRPVKLICSSPLFAPAGPVKVPRTSEIES